MYQVTQQVCVDARPGIHAYGSVRLVPGVTGILHGMPGTFEKYSMLRIHDLSFSWVEAKEAGVEKICVGENRSFFHIVRILQKSGLYAGFQQLCVGEAYQGF